MSETSQMLLRHILEAPYPQDSKVSLYSIFAIVSTNHRTAFVLFAYAANDGCQVR
jgi:hypothetical protein